MVNEYTTKRLSAIGRLGALGITALCAACASNPNTALLQAREAYSHAQADPQVASNAPVPLHEAEQSLALAAQANDEEEVNHLAYMAQKRVDLARAEAQTKVAEDSTKQQFKDREGMRVKSLEDELATLKAKKTERGYVITLGDLLFDYNKANLTAGAQQNLYPLVTFLKTYPDRAVAIEGHTDSRGTVAYNLELSGFRAQAVEDFLRENGVKAERITTQGFGQSRPVALNTTEMGRQQNRRVEVVISGQEKPATLSSGM
jgi:OmpA-OmpF porin, OOP family